VINSARQQWEDGRRRLGEASVDPVRYQQLCDLVGTVVSDLRRRLGSHFTMAELAAAHGVADDWVRDLVRDSLPEKPRVGVGDAALVQDAAFASFARGSVDWRP
jgi:hypothetical protein